VILTLIQSLAAVPSPYLSRLFRPTQPGHLCGCDEYWPGDGFGHRWGRHREFYIAVGPATRTVGILA